MAKGGSTSSSTSRESVIPEALLDSVNTTLRSLEQLKTQFLELVTLVKDPGSLSQMHPLLCAQAYFLLAKAIGSGIEVYGIDLDKHPINSELGRLSLYETKLKKAPGLE